MIWQSLLSFLFCPIMCVKIIKSRCFSKWNHDLIIIPQKILKMNVLWIHFTPLIVQVWKLNFWLDFIHVYGPEPSKIWWRNLWTAPNGSLQKDNKKFGFFKKILFDFWGCLLKNTKLLVLLKASLTYRIKKNLCWREKRITSVLVITFKSHTGVILAK